MISCCGLIVKLVVCPAEQEQASKQEVAYCLTVTTKRHDMLYVLEVGGLITNSIFAVR